LIRIFEMHAVVQRGVKWSESFQPAINCQFLPLTVRSFGLTPCSDYSSREATQCCHHIRQGLNIRG
jgi:hypothetical protein